VHLPVVISSDSTYTAVPKRGWSLVVTAKAAVEGCAVTRYKRVGLRATTSAQADLANR